MKPQLREIFYFWTIWLAINGRWATDCVLFKLWHKVINSNYDLLLGHILRFADVSVAVLGCFALRFLVLVHTTVLGHARILFLLMESGIMRPRYVSLNLDYYTTEERAVVKNQITEKLVQERCPLLNHINQSPHEKLYSPKSPVGRSSKLIPVSRWPLVRNRIIYRGLKSSVYAWFPRIFATCVNLRGDFCLATICKSVRKFSY